MRTAAVVAVLFLAGCAHVIEAEPVKEPDKIHCDLIFPPPPPPLT